MWTTWSWWERLVLAVVAASLLGFCAGNVLADVDAGAVAVTAADLQDPDPSVALDLIERMTDTRNYFFGAAGVLMLVMVLVKKKWSSLQKELVPHVTIAMGAIPLVVLVLMRPNVDGHTVFKQIFVIGFMTIGAWEAIGQYVFTSVSERWWPRVRTAVFKSPTAPAVPAPTVAESLVLPETKPPDQTGKP